MRINIEAFVMTIILFLVIIILTPWLVKLGVFLGINKLGNLFLLYSDWVVNF